MAQPCTAVHRNAAGVQGWQAQHLQHELNFEARRPGTTCMLTASCRLFRVTLRNPTRCRAQLATSSAPQAANAQLNPSVVDLSEIKALPRSVTLRALDIPPTCNLSPRVEHLLATKEENVVQLIEQDLQLPRVCAQCTGTHLRGKCAHMLLAQDFVLSLLRFGAVHYAPVPPETSAESPGHARSRDARASALAVYGHHVRFLLQLAYVHVRCLRQWCACSCTTRRRAEHAAPRCSTRTPMSECTCTSSALLRSTLWTGRWGSCVAHAAQRSTATDKALLQTRIVADCADFMVVNKPSGVPAAAPVDNMLETVTQGALLVSVISALLAQARQLVTCSRGGVAGQWLRR